MYRLLVVDDEEWITDSLAYMFEGLEDPVLEVSRAYSGPEALAQLNRHMYDIVVTDIQMPGMSGIDLLKEIHAKWPACHIIFLTGHDEFDYAYQALKYGASDFVLKNEGDEVIVAAVKKCVQKIQQEAMRAHEPMEAPAPHDAQHASEEFLRALLLGGVVTTQGMAKEMERLGLCLRPQVPLMLMVGRVDKEMTPELLTSIDRLVWDHTRHALCAEVVKVDRRLALWLMQPVEAGNEEHARAAITDLAETIQEECRGLLATELTFVLDPERVHWVDIPKRFARLRHAAADQLQADSGIALVKIAYFTAESLLLPGRKEAEREAQNAQAEQSGTEDSGNFFVRQLMTYIQTHLAEDLSLTALSERVYLNPAYLSRRFKELTGKNITETILQLRMEKACELLREENQKIAKIAAAVGYESAAHFSRVFKRYTGMPPQDYRDKNQ